jgi:hypothetical protein
VTGHRRVLVVGDAPGQRVGPPMRPDVTHHGSFTSAS